VSFLCDTNVLAELRKRAGDPNVLAWFEATPSSAVFLSVLVVGEIRRGITRLERRDPVQAAAIEMWLEQLLLSYADRIVPVTAEIAEEWGRLNGRDPLPPVDGLLAATAKVHGWTLVTRNTKDVEGTGVRILNPFTPHPA
jgi:predicted nucleic acid-binding protein